MNQHPLELIRQFNSYEVGDIGVSCITVSELQYGASKSRQKQKNQYRLNEFLVPLDILSFTQNATVFYGEIRAELERKGKIIGQFDLLIAAHALSENRILVTNNEKEFKRVPGLKIENWASHNTKT
jgi:tRNA(fMet)-specific endonuclease VapC